MSLNKTIRATSDVKVEVYQDGKRKYCILTDYNIKSEVTGKLILKGKLMDRSMSDDDVIKETLKIFAIGGDIINTRNNPTKNSDYYKIEQDPWSDVNVLKRHYGFTYYYLNNGCSIEIKWLDGDIVTGSYNDDSPISINKHVFVYMPKGFTENDGKGYLTEDSGVFYYSNDPLGKSHIYDGLTKDADIVNILISSYNTTISRLHGDNSYNLSLCYPDTQFCSIITYKSPIKSSPVSAYGNTQSITAPKYPISILGLPDIIQIKAKTDLPDFTVYIGDPPIYSSIDNYDNLSELDDEYTESTYQGYEEEKVIFNGIPLVLFSDAELHRDDNVSFVEGNGFGVQRGGKNIIKPTTVVSTTVVKLPTDLANVRNSIILTKQSTGNGYIDLNKDIIMPDGTRIIGADMVKSMNEFISDVLGPFSLFLRINYNDLYKKLHINGSTRGYVPKGGSSTSQHMKGQAIDMQILGTSMYKPDDNIRLLNALLSWYQDNQVGYDQLLFETRVKYGSCWVHLSYKRGTSRLQLIRYANDLSHSSSANTSGRYVLPPLSLPSLSLT